jgi:ferrochelatase
LSAFDALLVLSFGGPEGPDDVLPFLENVTRGRGVPRERLLDVARHYDHFGGVSPINARNRELVAAVSELIELPVYFGNRNWHPLVEDTVARMASDGVRRALVFATSAWGGFSACRQYHEDIARARAAVGDSAPDLVKLRHFFDHPEFVAAVADGVHAARSELGEAAAKARLVFTAHSVPESADAAAGTPDEGGHRYSRQVAEASRLVAAEVGVSEYDVVWQSRSGPPSVPWLAPDIVEHLDAVHASGAPAVLVCPGARRRARYGLRPGSHRRAAPRVRPDGGRTGRRADLRCTGSGAWFGAVRRMRRQRNAVRPGLLPAAPPPGAAHLLIMINSTLLLCEGVRTAMVYGSAPQRPRLGEGAGVSAG